MREGEKRLADPVDAFKSGLPVGGNGCSTGEGFLPPDLLGNGDEVANIAGSTSTEQEKKGRRYCEETPSRASP